ncbi:programmed cell death protein 11 [Echinococcus multilocularis]|uniref:Programmed cell death protein 11 n=1 Tax=Echinococcus multilocularis TaxID=6211 RepID=A0A087VWM1_ECHMU|nr:programmed cell death protein 11 [Echinococcus multilocularis]
MHASYLEEAVVAASSSLLTSLRNESRLAEVAQATMLGSETAHPLPRISSVEEYEVAVRNSPQNAHLWTLYAVHHQAAGDVERARTVLQRALDSPAASADNAGGFTGTILLSSLRLESSVATAACVGVERSVGSTPTAPLLDAVIAHIEQLDREAVTRRAVSVLSTAGLHSRSTATLDNLCVSHNFFNSLCARLEFEFGDVDRAIKLVEEQLVAHPQKKVVYVNYIQLLMSAGKSAEAE